MVRAGAASVDSGSGPNESRVNPNIANRYGACGPDPHGLWGRRRGDISQHVQRFQLSVNITGIGDGLVSSDSGGIGCQKTSGTCSAWYDSGAMVQLTASAHSGYVLFGWSGVCNGSGTCTISMNQTATVRAAFVNVALSQRESRMEPTPQTRTATPSMSGSSVRCTALKALTKATAVGTDTSALAWSATVPNSCSHRAEVSTGVTLNDASNIWSVNPDGSDLKALTRKTT